MIDEIVKVHCTNHEKDYDMHVLRYKPKAILEVAFHTVKIKLSYVERTRVFVGNLGGREFVVREDNLPKDPPRFKKRVR